MEREKAVLVGIKLESDSASSNENKYGVEQSIDELAELAFTAGLDVCARVIQKREYKSSAFLVGRGKVDEIRTICNDSGAGIIIFDDELSGVQSRNMEEATGVRVIDRTLLILDIFAQRAHTSEGKLQVELAQLKYRLPRLTGLGGQLSRLGGGIGTRGPGEKKLETDRRHIRRRISFLENELKRLGKRRYRLREGRKQNDLPVVVIVGYTNSGKSTLMNTLCGSGVFVEDKLFATLDPTTRRLTLPDGRKVLLVDTVGFISKLPHDLVEAFKSTLEEVVYADLLLHLVDASHSEADDRIPIVEDILEGLGAAGKPTILVYNKLDLAQGKLASMPGTKRNGCRITGISALKGQGLDSLLTAIMESLPVQEVKMDILAPYEEGWVMSYIYDNGKIVSSEYTDGGIKIKALIPFLKAKKLDHYLIGATSKKTP